MVWSKDYVDKFVDNNENEIIEIDFDKSIDDDKQLENEEFVRDLLFLLGGILVGILFIFVIGMALL